MAILLTENCIGCEACQTACLPSCIELRRDEMGFLRAYISENGCTGCGRCKIVCPQLRSRRASPKIVFAYQNPNQTDLDSSQSGGAFLALARTVIENNGIVYGVKWSQGCTRAEFAGATTIAQLRAFSGSKYVSADPSCLLQEIKKEVITGRVVLFSGLPCQVAAVRNLFPYRENLVLVEVLCMGPMSPEVWKRLRQHMPLNLSNFLFRDKSRRGWGKADSQYEFSNGTRQSFCSERFPAWKIFSTGVTMSSSCTNCKFRSFERTADITIGDFWGIEHLLKVSDEVSRKGISIVHVQTAIGQKYLFSLENGFLGRFIDLESIRKFNLGYQQIGCDMKLRQKSFINFSRRVGVPVSVMVISLLSKYGHRFPRYFK